MRSQLALLPLSSVLILPACTPTDCIPTRTSAQDASKVDLVAPAGSAVLRATLTAEDSPLEGYELRFDLQADGDTVYDADAATGERGSASLDLKRVDVGALAGVVRGNGFRVSFAGDSTYCASSDGAAFKVVRAPAGLP